MKRFFFCTGILVLLLGMSHTHASDVSFSQLNSSGTIKTTIGVSTTATVANISVDIQNNPQIAITGTLTAYRTVSSTGVCSDSILTGPVSVADGQSTYHHTFKMENLEANHQYCFKYSDDNGVTFAPKVFKTESGILTIPYNWPLISSNATGQKVLVSGKINTATYTGSVGSLAIDLQISANPFPVDQPGDSIVGDQTRNYARVNVDTSSPEGVASDGSYYFQITGLAPSRKYYCRQVISFKNTTTILDVKGENCVLDSDQGIVPQGSKLEQSLEEQKSYHLLAPWPGLSELMDPDLCLQKQKEGTLSPNAVCDINGFLDFAFKTLIGITAVMLVLRLMYEGYQYIVTDVPFLKASAKSGFFTALLGLLLALSAYLILNTINPKLVSNTFNIDSVAVGVTPLATIDTATFSALTNGKTILAPQEYLNKVKQYTAGDKKLECLMVAAINNESHWRPNVIGCDECVGGATGNNVKSRRVFIQSGVKLDGSALPSGASATDKAMYNPNTFNGSVSGYGLDWRFSKGMGLTQVTVYPDGYNGSEAAYVAKAKPGGDLFNNRNNPQNTKQAGSNESVLDFIKNNIDPDKNIQTGIVRMKAAIQQCGSTNIAGIFNAYNSGGCGNGIATGSRVTDYNSCIAGNIQIKTN